MRTSLLVSLFVSAGLLIPRLAQADATADGWLAGLYDEIAGDLAAGEPLVVHAHVPLCDNRIIPCGSPRLGDGDEPKGNLYWATSGGFRGWFGRKGSGWKQVARPDHDDEDILDARVWHRRVAPTAAWRGRKVKRAFDVYVVAYAWRGTAIDRALEAFVRDVYDDEPRIVSLGKGKQIEAGGAAHVVAYVGHNRWMDIPEYDFDKAAKRYSSKQKKGIIAVACLTEPYLAAPLSSSRRVPLLMTRSLLFAGAHSFEGAVRSFAGGESLAEIRKTAIAAYAEGQGKSVKRVRSAFSNPSDSRWGK